jgi:ribokinase
MSRPRIVVIGSLVFDFVARAPRLPRKGETILGDRFGMFPGGKGANQAVQAARLGAEVYLVGRIGDDVLGERLLASLKENGVATDFVRRDPAVKTAACCIHVDDQGQNAIIIVPEANLACSRADVDAAADVLRSAGVVVCQLEIALPTVEYAVGVAARQGVPVILNPAPAQPLPAELLAQVTILTPNETEAEILTGMPVSPSSGAFAWESAVAQKLRMMGPQTVILTLGERGAYLATGDLEQHVPTYPVQVVDATAAGDAFTGALAVALGEGQLMDAAIRFANAAGTLATTRAGAQPSLASRAEVEGLLGQSGAPG